MKVVTQTLAVILLALALCFMGCSSKSGKRVRKPVTQELVIKPVSADTILVADETWMVYRDNDSFTIIVENDSIKSILLSKTHPRSHSIKGNTMILHYLSIYYRPVEDLLLAINAEKYVYK